MREVSSIAFRWCIPGATLMFWLACMVPTTALASPRLDRPCNVFAFHVGDTADGALVRAEPQADAAIVTRLPPTRRDADGRLIDNEGVRILGVCDGWFLLDTYRGLGWTNDAALAVRPEGHTGLAGPQAGTPIAMRVETPTPLNATDGLWSHGRLTDCLGEAAQVRWSMQTLMPKHRQGLQIEASARIGLPADH
jgi:hypothetical protein